jgi:hypothetical protein
MVGEVARFADFVKGVPDRCRQQSASFKSFDSFEESTRRVTEETAAGQCGNSFHDKTTYHKRRRWIVEEFGDYQEPEELLAFGCAM